MGFFDNVHIEYFIQMVIMCATMLHLYLHSTRSVLGQMADIMMVLQYRPYLIEFDYSCLFHTVLSSGYPAIPVVLGVLVQI